MRSAHWRPDWYRSFIPMIKSMRLRKSWPRKWSRPRRSACASPRNAYGPASMRAAWNRRSRWKIAIPNHIAYPNAGLVRGRSDHDVLDARAPDAAIMLGGRTKKRRTFGLLHFRMKKIDATAVGGDLGDLCDAAGFLFAVNLAGKV